MNFKKIVSLTFALTFSIAGASIINPQIVAEASSVNYVLNVDTGNVAYKEYTFNLRQNENLKAEVLKEASVLRAKLWDENILYTLDNTNSKKERLQDVAKAYGYKNKEAYINGLSWSNDLERIAIQRAYEQTITGISHNRPDGSSGMSTTTTSGISPNGEIIARNTRIQSPAISFEQWSFAPRTNYNNKSEYQLLKEADGVFTSGNGHLHNILNPQFKHIGYGELNNTSDKWNIGLAVFSFKNASNNQASANLVGETTLYVGKPKVVEEKAPEAIKPQANTTKTDELPADVRASLEKAVADAKAQISVAENLLNNFPNTVKNVRGKLSQMVKDSKLLIEEANKMLGN